MTKILGEGKEADIIATVCFNHLAVRLIRPELVENGVRYPAQEIYITDGEIKEVLNMIIEANRAK